MPARILLEGRPGTGKTTALRRFAALLPTHAATGFTTEEIRQSGAASVSPWRPWQADGKCSPMSTCPVRHWQGHTASTRASWNGWRCRRLGRQQPSRQQGGS
ncbi:nucleoside-triphosphatase [Streptomyces sp. CG1]|uniref:nucleoside-triphosphatase n=1 Tax=Streptomyces sp. CG1 TaxID=1287523 RepID=UPI0034E1D5EC